MALILTAYDVSLGATRTSTVNAPNGLDCQVLTTNFVGVVYFHAQKTQASGQWVDIKDDKNNPIKFIIRSGLDNGINIQGLGGSNVSFKVVPSGTCTGTISFDVIAS